MRGAQHMKLGSGLPTREPAPAYPSIYNNPPGTYPKQSLASDLAEEVVVNNDRSSDSGHLPARGFREHCRSAWAATKRGWAKCQKWHEQRNHAIPGYHGPRCTIIRTREAQREQLIREWSTGDTAGGRPKRKRLERERARRSAEGRSV